MKDVEPEQVTYFQGQFVPAAQAQVSVMTHAFNYGTGCFEGIRGYANPAKDEVYLFRLREHMERLHRSAHVIACALKPSVDELCALTTELVRRNGQHGDVYIRPIVYKSGTGIGVTMNGVPDDLTIFCVPFGNYIDIEGGLHCCISSWRRSTDNSVPPRAKITGGYINAALAKHEALLNGYGEAIMLTDAGFVSEGSAENIFMVLNDTLVTPGVNECVLEGITRATITQLAQEQLGMHTVERAISRTELYTADEVFLCGTGAQISPVVSIDHRRIGAGRIGLRTKQLQQLYFSVVRGDDIRYRSWLTPVYQVPEAAIPAAGAATAS